MKIELPDRLKIGLFIIILAAVGLDSMRPVSAGGSGRQIEPTGTLTPIINDPTRTPTPLLETIPAPYPDRYAYLSLVAMNAGPQLPPPLEWPTATPTPTPNLPIPDWVR